MEIYINGNIITMDEAMPHADWMVVKDGRIVDMGLDTDYYNYANVRVRVIDLKGLTVIPGFWESHLHIVDGTKTVIELNLRGCNTPEEFRAHFAKYVEELSDGEWILGHGWDESKIFEGSFPDRMLLDALCSTRPVILTRMDGHSLCANTKAIELMGLDRLPPSPEIPLGSDGRPTGMFYENAAIDISNKIAEKAPDSYIERIVLKAQELFLKNGICSVNDICTKYGRYFDIYSRLQAEGRLKLRITAAPYGSDEDSIKAFEDRRTRQNPRLMIGPPKYFIDGSFGSRTALLYEDYADDNGNRGLKLLSDEQLEEIISQNVTAGRPTAIHAIGDQAVSCILNAAEKTGIDFHQKDIRSRIEHIQIIKTEDIDRFRKLNITASFQPVFLYEEELTASRLGKDRFDRVYKFRSMLQSGANVIFNSDWPYGGGAFPQKPDGSSYVGFEPLLGIHAAASKPFSAKEAVPAEACVAAYTVNAAYVNYRENELGKLKKGYTADFVVLSEDILKIEPRKIADIDVLMTFIDGEEVYSKL